MVLSLVTSYLFHLKCFYRAQMLAVHQFLTRQCVFQESWQDLIFLVLHSHYLENYIKRRCCLCKESSYVKHGSGVGSESFQVVRHKV